MSLFGFNGNPRIMKDNSKCFFRFFAIFYLLVLTNYATLTRILSKNFLSKLILSKKLKIKFLSDIFKKIKIGRPERLVLKKRASHEVKSGREINGFSMRVKLGDRTETLFDSVTAGPSEEESVEKENYQKVSDNLETRYFLRYIIYFSRFNLWSQVSRQRECRFVR